jgi:transcriptional regulator with XRE-family HTH domain
MSANSYELSFEVAEMSEAAEDRVSNRFDSVIAVHGGVTTVTLTAEGDTCIGAALSTISSLREAGVEPLRLVDDAVSRSEIARRMGVTPQSVGQWIRGERHSESAFPAPYILAGGGLWLWGEVLKALANRGVEIEDIGYPSRRDIQEIGGVLVHNASRAHAVPTRTGAR